MLNFFTRRDKESIQQIYSFFPKILSKDVKKVISFLVLKKHCIHDNYTTYSLNGETLKMYSRLYFDEPKGSIKMLTARQKTILYCIFTRHHNGYIRQEYTEKLKHTYEYFVIPFLVQLIGEYIAEILVPINDSVDNYAENYIKFINENPIYWNLSKSRMISYWNVYYRKNYINLKEYIGYKIVNKIDKLSVKYIVGLPIFKYNPNPVLTGCIEISESYCEVCNQQKGCKATAIMSCIENIYDVCPWCIKDGNASDMYDGEFVIHIENSNSISIKTLKELSFQTISYPAYQELEWMVHCNDGCEFHGHATEKDFNNISEEEIKRLIINKYFDLSEIKEYQRSQKVEELPYILKFKCRHCNEIKFLVDYD